jgi:hypothetical protein
VDVNSRPDGRPSIKEGLLMADCHSLYFEGKYGTDLRGRVSHADFVPTSGLRD